MQSDLEQAFGKSDVTSPKMRAALREWLDLYYGAPRPGEDPAPRLAALIVGKLCRTVFAEYAPRLQGAPGAALRRRLDALHAVRKTAMQIRPIGPQPCTTTRLLKRRIPVVFARSTACTKTAQGSIKILEFKSRSLTLKIVLPPRTNR